MVQCPEAPPCPFGLHYVCPCDQEMAPWLYGHERRADLSAAGLLALHSAPEDKFPAEGRGVDLACRGSRMGIA